MRQIRFEYNALEELEDWVRSNPKTASRILDLIQEICKTPFEGKGKPEPLKHKFKGYWSRRINEDHRIVYSVTQDTISILSCKGHYQQ
jgi:toxin YoeB